ncbi:galactose-1-phosphate uridylyltransferase [Paenibacillus swuensis]|uniref:Galactose-1-phosphate uridylyltransferase n=1 Tax=Paenibacillus swuensis TaxID=1178515 RepID=A0A172TJ39_9BACL|nr:UDP-glucose--hexose-1-phosphate uridylyltransferase [Paenibacillus swuensis]ANE46982.1 galactose-1-phosphate uridylyltransferase [Paenibacillus swuensis]
MTGTETVLHSADVQQAALQIERLLAFAQRRGLVDELDVIPSRNALLDLFGIPEPYAGAPLPEESLDSPVEVLEALLDYAASAGLLEADTLTHRDLMDARIMGLLMPRQSEVVRRFRDTTETRGIEAATDAYYQFSTDSNYIRMDRIRKNQYWLTETPYGELEITVNLSKPEKDPREIALLKNVQQSNYPSCLLCVENVGYAGRLNHPARQNHRVIPLTLTEEAWNFQFSPYVYYNEHSIIFHNEHVPMKMSSKTFARLLDFLDSFPHYFIGSNADLPIVGGSILNHDHFQGGRHTFAMERAKTVTSFSHRDYPGVKGFIVEWPMSVIRLSGQDKESLLKLASSVFAHWCDYSHPMLDIAAYTETDGTRTPHNTITPIARRNAAGEYELDLVLRNNRTSQEHPDGIFHPHQDLHHIKKENIGLIEVMGLAVLPGRLKEELEQISAILTGAKELSEGLKQDPEHPLYKHTEWIRAMVTSYGTSMQADEAEAAVRKEVGLKFLQVLEDAGVYKQDLPGQAAFRRFMVHAGFEETKS